MEDQDSRAAGETGRTHVRQVPAEAEGLNPSGDDKTRAVTRAVTTRAVTLSSVVLLLALVSVAASFLPALRAASIDPMQALRSE